MPQRIEQAQWACNRCQKHTLHQRTVTETNHTFHLLMTVLCCGLWLPVWLLLSVVTMLERQPFLCTQCGQRAGELTAEQRTAIAAERAKDRAETRKRYAELYGSMMSQIKHGAMIGASATFEEARRLPGRTDRALKVVAGEGNDLIHWFLRFLTIVLTTGLGVVILAILIKAISAVLASAG